MIVVISVHGPCFHHASVETTCQAGFLKSAKLFVLLLFLVFCYSVSCSAMSFDFVIILLDP